jgi:hypothetical protein
MAPAAFVPEYRSLPRESCAVMIEVSFDTVAMYPVGVVSLVEYQKEGTGTALMY